LNPMLNLQSLFDGYIFDYVPSFTRLVNHRHLWTFPISTPSEYGEPV
jgi:hypothetical protein